MAKPKPDDIPEFEDELASYREALRQQGLPPKAIEKMAQDFREDIEAAACRQARLPDTGKSTP